MVEGCWNALELQLKGWRSNILTGQVLDTEAIQTLDQMVLVRSKNN
jgi:hypothetical protein